MQPVKLEERRKKRENVNGEEHVNKIEPAAITQQELEDSAIKLGN